MKFSLTQTFQKNKMILMFWTGILLFCFGLTADWLIIQWDHISTDFKSFYFASKIALIGGDIYNVDSLNLAAYQANINSYVFPYLYSPWFAYIAMPMALLVPQTAQIYWSVISVILMSIIVILTILAVNKIFNHNNDITPNQNWFILRLFLISILLISILPFRNNIQMGQINILVLTFIVLSFYSYLHRADIVSGICLGIAILIKITPLLFLFLFLARKRYRLVISSILSMLFLIGVTLCLGAYPAWLKFFSRLPTISYGTAIPGLFSSGAYPNFSIAGLLSRLIDNKVAIKYIATLIGLILFIVLYLFVLRIKNTIAEQTAILPFLILMIVVSPLAYLHHVIYLFPGALFSLVYIWTYFSNRKRIIAIILFIIPLFIASVDFPLYYGHWHLNGGSSQLITAINLYMLLLLFIYSLWLINTTHISDRMIQIINPLYQNR